MKFWMFVCGWMWAGERFNERPINQPFSHQNDVICDEVIFPWAHHLTDDSQENHDLNQSMRLKNKTEAFVFYFSSCDESSERFFFLFYWGVVNRIFIYTDRIDSLHTFSQMKTSKKIQFPILILMHLFVLFIHLIV